VSTIELFTMPFCLGRAVARVVRARAFTSESRLLSLASPCGICGGRNVLERVFLRLLRFSVVSIIYPVIHIHILFMYL
jgi:hypothetical protein